MNQTFKKTASPDGRLIADPHLFANAPAVRCEISDIVSHFQIHGEFRSAASYGSGHINDTFCVVVNQGGTPVRYILQRINDNVFNNPVALMDNVQRVTAHIGKQLELEGDSSRRVLSLIPARDGRCWHRDKQGKYWRAYIFIENARTYDAVESADQAFEAAKAFGRFQKLLIDLPSPRLHDTILDFHHTPKRLMRLEQAIEKDAFNRAQSVEAEIEFALRRKPMTSVLIDACLPERVTHNDTKLNNVMLDDATKEGICVIDLDTVMPGFVLYDFGDMVRTSTSTAKEDERDLSKVKMQMHLFTALALGYATETADFLTKREREYMAFSSKLITFEIGLRFLTDFLEGDLYFKIHRDGHNLDRCRTQFKLAKSIEEQEEKMNKVVEGI